MSCMSMIQNFITSFTLGHRGGLRSGCGAPKCLGAKLCRILMWTFTDCQFRTTDAIVGTTGHELHHLRKNALAQYFSKSSVARLEPLIQGKVDRLCERLKTFQG